MKTSNLFLSLLFLLCSLGLYGQIIFNETFDNVSGSTAGGAGTYSFAPGWTLFNNDGLTPNADVSYVNDAWERREDFIVSPTDSCAFSTSWYDPAGTADDWMISPAIIVPTDGILLWNANAPDVSFNDGYEVWIGDSPTIAGMTAGTMVFSTSGEVSDWVTRFEDISTFAGQTKYVGFRNNSTDRFLLMIDDVIVQVALDNDIVAGGGFPSEYTFMPESQVTPFSFSNTIFNFGLNPATDVSYEIIVERDGVVVHTDITNAIASLPSFTTSTILTAPSFLPVTGPNNLGIKGVYEIQMIAQMNETDQDLDNDTLSSFIIIDQNTYRRDANALTGSLGIGAENGGYLGQEFDVTNMMYPISSVTVFYNNGYTTAIDQMQVAIWDMVAGAPNAIIAETISQPYPDPFTPGLYTLPLTSSINLTSGNYAITAIEFDSTLAIGTSVNIHTPLKTWLNWPTNPNGTWSHNEDFGFIDTYIIRPNFCSGENPIVTGGDASCVSPVTATVNLPDAVGLVNYEWSSGDIGESVELFPGEYTVTATDAFYCQYSETVTINEVTIGDNEIVDDIPIDAGVYQATQTINSSGRVINSTTVDFFAGEEINLNNDFEVETGAEFLADVNPCEID